MKFRARLEARSLKILFQKKTIIIKFAEPPPYPPRRHQIKYFSVSNFRNIEKYFICLVSIWKVILWLVSIWNAISVFCPLMGIYWYGEME